MPRLIIHLGFHKTGSTFLQSSLHTTAAKSNPAGFVDGWFVTNAAHEIDKDKRGGHLLAGKAAPDILAKLRGHLDRNGADCILSNENLIGPQLGQGNDGKFYPDAHHMIRFFDQLNDTFEIEYVFYVRRQDRFLESTFLNLVRDGFRGEFSDYINRIDFKDLNYNKFFNNLKAVTENRILVVPFEIIKGNPTRFLESFTDMFSPGIVLEQSDNERTSLSKQGIDIIQTVAPMLSGKDKAKFDRFIAKQFSSKTHKKKDLFPKFLSELMVSNYAPSNKAMFKNHIDPKFYDVAGEYGVSLA